MQRQIVHQFSRNLQRLFSTTILNHLPRTTYFSRSTPQTKPGIDERDVFRDSVTVRNEHWDKDMQKVASALVAPAREAQIVSPIVDHCWTTEEFRCPADRHPSHAFRWETPEPSTDELYRAEAFFVRYPANFLWSAEKFKKIDFGEVPEVAFLGRSNVGKSSLLNALLNNKSMAYTSSKPGRTRLMNAFGINHNKLVLLDMPGYGHASRAEWGVQIMKYLTSRKQFRRAFLLIDAKHGLKTTDHQFLDILGYEGVPYQIVFSKVDRVRPEELDKMFWSTREYLTNSRSGASALGEILATAGAPTKKGKKKIGLNPLRWAVLVAAGLDGNSI